METIKSKQINMALSKITITFNADLLISEYITIDVTYPSAPNLAATLTETWVNFRSAQHEVTKGIATTTIGERSAMNFVEAFNIDYGPTNYNVSRNANVVTIIAPTTDMNFESGESDNGNVIFNITNFNGTILNITDVAFSEATNPCTHIKVDVTTSTLATSVSSPVVIDPNAANPFSFELLRALSTTLTCSDNEGQTASQPLMIPDALNENNVSISVVTSPTGATATVSVQNTNGLSLEYSLDNLSWQSSNVFSGLAVGNFTVYIKDQFGCSVNKNFAVDEYGIQTPYFNISQSNSIRFANRLTWGDCSNYKNDNNTLSCEAFAKNSRLAYKEIQQFQSCDIIRTQFKSNYDDISATAIEEDGTETALTIEQMTNNIGLKDKRDAIKYNLLNGKTGIYFTTGNIYDFDTGVDTGEDYALHGALPVWGVIGNYIQTDQGWFAIDEIYYDETKNAEVLVIAHSFTGFDTSIQVASIYNAFNYEVYEFAIDMVDYLNKNIQVRINNDDYTFENIVYLSEVINVKIRQENTVEIRYKNTNNTAIFYATGIEHKLRLPIFNINGKVDDTSESYKTDTSAFLLNSEIHESDEFTFEPVTKGIMRKLVQALSHDTVKIDGVGYVKDSIDVGDVLDDTNLYIVKALMIKAGEVFNSQVGDDNSEFSNESIEIPGIVDTGEGFVIY